MTCNDEMGSLFLLWLKSSLLALNLYGLEKKRLYGYVSGKAYKPLCQLLKSDAATVKNINMRDPDVFMHDINSLARALHKFFSELPEPLLTMAYYTAFRKAIKTKDTADQRNQLRAIISSLTEAHHETLKVLVTHLSKVAANIDVNRQGSEALGEYWAIAILQGGKPKTRNTAEIGQLYWIMQMIIEILMRYLGRKRPGVS